MAKKTNTKYTYTPYDVSNGQLTEDQLVEIWKDILGIANPQVVGLPAYDNSQPNTPYYDNTLSENKNYYLSDDFQDEFRSIINAINKTYTDAKKAKEGADAAKEAVFNSLGNAKENERASFNKLSAVMGKSNIIDGLLDYYTNGLGFNTTSFKGLYKEYTQAEIKNGAVDLIPLNSILNSGDIIKDETGTYYKISSQALVNDGADAKPTIADWKAAGVIEDMNVTYQSDINKYSILYKGEYTKDVWYDENDLITYNNNFYLVTNRAIGIQDFDLFEGRVVPVGNSTTQQTLNLAYDVI